MEFAKRPTTPAAPDDVADSGLSAWLEGVRRARERQPTTGMIRELRKPRFRPPGPEVASVTDLHVPGSSGLKARLYRSSGLAQPLTVFVHGGGFAFGGLESHDRLCRRLAQLTGAAVLAVDYRLAPEHPAPAAVDDVVRAVQWAAGAPEQLGPALPRIGLAGDSAGGLLAFLAARRLAGTPAEPGALLLAYPNADLTLGRPSIREKALGWGLPVDHLAFFISLWLPDPTTRALADFSPLHGFTAGDCSTTPLMPVPTLIATAEHDPLRDEGEQLAQRLAASGTPVEYLPHPGLVHGFLTLDTESAAARLAGDALLKPFGALLAAENHGPKPVPTAHGTVTL